MFNFILDVFSPLVIKGEASMAFAGINIGDIFKEGNCWWKLVYRDAVKIKLRRYFWWNFLLAREGNVSGNRQSKS
jgi:hypothetical protein